MFLSFEYTQAKFNLICNLFEYGVTDPFPMSQSLQSLTSMSKIFLCGDSEFNSSQCHG